MQDSAITSHDAGVLSAGRSTWRQVAKQIDLVDVYEAHIDEPKLVVPSIDILTNVHPPQAAEAIKLANQLQSQATQTSLVWYQVAIVYTPIHLPRNKRCTDTLQ